MRGRVIGWMALLGALLVAPADAVADGVAFSGADLGSLQPITQNEQMAAIVYQDGVERLIIAISLELEEADNALWIFPLPGNPEQTKVDVLDVFPDLDGTDVVERARQRIDAFMALASATQVYPVFVRMAMGFGRHLREVAGIGVAAAAVTVYGQMDRYGVHAETVRAASLADLADYLRGKKAAVPPEQLAAFRPYLVKGYVLVLAWLASREELLRKFPQYREGSYPRRERWPCLYVEFPTDRAFYPLRPTSGYGRSTIPVTLFVMGHVRPQTAPSLASRLRVSYHELKRFWRTTPPELVAGLPAQDIPYTMISVRTRAENFTDDLWFRPGAPLHVRYARLVAWLTWPPQAVLVWLLAVALASYVCAGLAALPLYHRWRGYAQMGFWNLLTLIAFAVRVLVARGEDGMPIPQAGSFVFVFTATYTVLMILAYMLLVAPLI